MSTPLRFTFFTFGCALLVKRLGRLLPGLFLPIHALAHRNLPASLAMRDRVHAIGRTFTRAARRSRGRRFSDFARKFCHPLEPPGHIQAHRAWSERPGDDGLVTCRDTRGMSQGLSWH